MHRSSAQASSDNGGFVKPTISAAQLESRAGRPERDGSRPPVSPITPSATLAQLAPGSAPVYPPLPQSIETHQEGVHLATEHTQSQQTQPPHQEPQTSQAHGTSEVPTQQQRQDDGFIPPPQPTSFDEDENTDVLALRSALAILMHQKEKSEQDIRTLHTLRQGLREDPERFTNELTSGNSNEDDEENEDSGADVQADEGNKSKSAYPKFPGKQNVIRCPPINWAKYHIVGESLDKMHEEQRSRPRHGEPTAGPIPQAGNPFYTPTTALSGPQAAEHHVYKQYDPLTDTLPDNGAYRDGVQTRRSSKRP